MNKAGYYALHWDVSEWVAYNPYKFTPNYIYWQEATIVSSTRRDDCIACVEAMGYTWAGA